MFFSDKCTARVCAFGEFPVHVFKWILLIVCGFIMTFIKLVRLTSSAVQVVGLLTGLHNNGQGVM